MPRSLVVDPTFAWSDRPRPHHRYADTVIYEVHVKGFTMAHPDVPPELRGTYAGLGHEAALTHLVDLGVTAVELLPVHQSVPESFLLDRGLTNYWGYNTIGYFAPHDAYSAAVRAGRPGGQVAEFKAMVDALHGAGLEVILDVVFNHTAEGNHLGPTLCFRGLDNPAYYHLEPDDPRYYLDTTGCGNTLNAGDPVTLRLIMDSLRYWMTEMRVDGFRFDLAPTLARQEGGFDQVSAFFDLVAQDPVVSEAKLVAEPWDVGQGDSYELGRFPPLWREWNGKYRDTVRDFWRSHEGLLGDFASRFTGSSDLFASPGGGRRRRSTWSRSTTASPWPTWSPTTPSTTRPTARPTATAPTTTGRGTAGSRGPPTTRTSSPCGAASAGPCWPPCCCPSGCPSSSAATRSGGPSRGTTMPTARTTPSPGSTGRTSTPTCWLSPGD